jgi:hypothetical protein
MQAAMQNKERVIVYIDGFNLYFGMREAEYHHCRWLNVDAMVKKLLKQDQELIEIQYFTSRGK